MVKLRGALGSAKATGTLGRATILSTWKGRTYARTKTPPSNPQTAAQQTVRMMLTFLAQQWKTLTTARQATWETPAKERTLPPYNAYLTTNLQRWSQFQSPGQTYPVKAYGSLPIATFDSATGQPGQATLQFHITSVRSWWPLLIFRSDTSPVVPSRDNCIAILPANEDDPRIYIDQNLPPGTYHYQVRFCTEYGKMGPNETERSATVT